MPIKWYGTGDNSDPLYFHFSRIVNFTIHCMIFAALNSGLWFYQLLNKPWDHLEWISFSWFAVLIFHAGYIFYKKRTLDQIEVPND